MLPGQTCVEKLDWIHKYSWMVQKWTQSMISTSFWGNGKIHLTFENCNNQGVVRIFIDDQEIAKSKETGGPTSTRFFVQEGTILSIKADDKAIIRLLDLAIECGKHTTFYSFTFENPIKVLMIVLWADVCFVIAQFC